VEHVILAAAGGAHPLRIALYLGVAILLIAVVTLALVLLRKRSR
jgi:hypothetical protein